MLWGESTHALGDKRESAERHDSSGAARQWVARKKEDRCCSMTWDEVVAFFSRAAPAAADAATHAFVQRLRTPWRF
jgi:hypothetical protein